jgi:hypothetical protein
MSSNSQAEKAAVRYFTRLKNHINNSKGRFLRDEAGGVHVITGDHRIPLNLDRQNTRLAELMLSACKVSTLGGAAQAAIQRLQVHAQKSSKLLRLRSFSACADDGTRLYVPVQEGAVLVVTGKDLMLVPNGTDGFWLEHPDSEPFTFDRSVDVVTALETFQRLLVDTQACSEPMKWFLGMAEGLFPYIRESCPARLIIVRQGPSQSGKTSGAQRFTLLHGLGPVKGDYSPAALGNMPDIGLLVMDNREQANFSQALIDYCLFLATGAERGRSFADGTIRRHSARPVGVITTIEGIFKDELRKRVVVIEFEVTGRRLPRAAIEREITSRRHEMLSGLMHVLYQYFRIVEDPIDVPNPIPEFEEHFTALCRLLYAFADVSGRTRSWADEIISGWNAYLAEPGDTDSEYEQPILRAIAAGRDVFEESTVQHNGRSGVLYVARSSEVLSLLQAQHRADLALPKNASGLSKRLISDRFSAFEVLHEGNAPDIEALKRTADRRVIGFFVPLAGDALRAAA